MNRNTYRLVFSRVHHMLVAVEESATSNGKRGSGEVAVAATIAAALLVPLLAHAQIVPGGANAPKVQQTANGISQVNVNRPSGAGVSMNTYSQFDVQKSGAILNNSATVTNTQLAGQIAGNPNYAAGQSAKIIVNQVNSANPVQLNGYVEVAGPGATVVLASPSGISVNGGGFINAPRAVLTTGTPVIDGNGALTGYNVTGGSITVQGAGFNASNVDQVDLISRAVQINAATYANTLNVITGTNYVDHNSLSATPIAGNGAPPAASIDVSQLGGMYAGKILLVSNEYGVGVSTQGVIAAQSGDLTLQSNGQLVLAGKTGASGNVALNATQGISNTGTTYAGQSLSASTSGVLANSGTLAAQGTVNASAGAVASTGALAAGVDSNGNVTQAASLNVSASGALTATGQNVAGGNETLAGGSVNLAGSQTAANGNLSLAATGGDLNLAGARTSAGGAINASATGALVNDHGSMTAGSSATLAAGSMSNQGGSISAQGPLVVQTSGQIANQGGSFVSQNTMQVRGGAIANNAGTMQAAGAFSLSGSSLDNTAGYLLSLNGDGLNLGITGTLLNGIGGVIGGNGNVNVSAYTFTNAGQLSAGANAVLQAWGLTNSGTVTAGSALTATASGALVNAGGTLSGTTTAVSGASIDNTKGDIEGDTVAVSTPGNLVNEGGSITQSGTAAQTITAGGMLDNANGGKIASNATNLSISGAAVNNNSGSIQHAGTGTLDVGASGAVSSVAGTIAGNGSVNLHGASVDTSHGSATASQNLSVQAQTIANEYGKMGAGNALNANASGGIDNKGGSMVASSVTAQTGGTLDSSNGDIEANQLALSAATLLNRGGSITQYGASPMGFSVSGLFDNSAGGTFQTNAPNVTLSPGALDNDSGTITHAGAGKLTIDAGSGAGAASNVGGRIQGNGGVEIDAGALNNAAGSVTGQSGLTAAISGTLDNESGKLLSNKDLSVASGTLDNDNGQIGAGANATIQTGSMTNSGGTVVAPNLTIQTTGTLDNSNGDIEANQLSISATDLINRAGTITQYGTGPTGFYVSGTYDNTLGTFQTNATNVTLAPGALINDGGKIVHAGTGTLTLTPGNGAGAFSNVGGQVISAGQIAALLGSLNNQGGVFAAQGAINATVAGDVNNTQGAIRSLSSLSLTEAGALTNVNGQIQTGTGSAGDASTLAIHAASVDDTNGLIGNLGTGDTTVEASSQIVNSGGVMTGNGNVGVQTSALVNTQGGQVSGANVSVQADTVDNSNGAIGSLAGTTGDVAITTTGAMTNTNGQVGATHDLSVNAATLTGGGAYSAANNVRVTVQGDFAPTPDLQFAAGNNLTFTLPGTFTNGALLEAANNLNINAGDVENSGVMMAGGTLATHSDTLENTGTMVGGSVSLNANTRIVNAGPTALIGATDSDGKLELLAPEIDNVDSTTMTDTQATTAIYGLGKVVLAGGKDANGNYTNANLIRNSSGLIESAGDMELHAGQVTNTRTTMTTTGLNQPVDPDLLTELGISMSGRTGQVGIQDPDSIGGVFIDPPHGGQYNSTYQYTTYTGVAVANLIASISPQAQIIAGGNLDASNVGLFQNYWSAVAAVGNIAAPVSLDQNSWQGQTAPEVQVTYSGLYHYRNYDGSVPDWTYSFCASGCNAPADIRFYSLPGYESSFVAGGTLSGTGISINNTAGNAGIPSIGLAPGQALSGVTIGGISGSAGANAGSASSVAGNAGGTKGGASTASGGAMVDPAIASATALTVLQNLTIPQGGLFSPATAPGATYLIETNPAFTNQKTFISSDYYLQQLGLNPQTTEKRLGDGFYEQQLVRNQITSLTGKAVLGPYTDLQSMYQSLLAAGASLSQSLDLPLGMSLSPDEVAALTSNVIIMQTEVVDGQSVLVPVVYLARASQQNMNGPLIAATDIDLQNTQTFVNSGTVQASNTMSIQGQQINNAFGKLQSGGLMSLTTTGNVDLTSATVNAGSLALNAGGNLILNTAVNTVNQVSATGATRTSTTLGPIASVNVAGNAAIVTGGNFEQNGANLNVGGNLGMAVGGDWTLGSVQTGEQKVVARANGVSNTNVNQTTGSVVNVGGVSQIGVGGDLTATGANLNLAGGGTLAANGSVTLQAAKATSTTDSNSSGSDSHGSYSESLHRSDDSLTATTLNSGNSLTVASGKNINVTGSAISLDKGTATLAAAGDVNIGAATETHVENGQEQHSHSNVVSGKEVSSSRDTTATLSQGSMVSADGVQIASGHDINVAGSTIVGTSDVALSAAHDVNITTTQNTMQSSGTYQEKSTGLGTSGLTVTVGTSKNATTDQESSVTNNASAVGSLNGNLAISAGNTLHVTGSDLVAGGNVTGTAANVIIDAATDTAHQAQTQKSSSSGVAIGLSGSVGDAINNAYAQGESIGHSAGSGNDRAAALHSIAAAGDAVMAGSGAAALAGGATGPKAPSIGVQVSVGSSNSQSQSSENQTTQRGSSVTAGGTAAFVATSGDLTVAGSNVSANDVVLAAKNNVNIVNTTNTDSTRSSNSSNSASVGVSVGTNGVGISASMANAHGDGNSDASIQNASHVTGANSVTIVSGGDTNITGSQVAGNQVTAAVGGNLNIASVQDTTVSTAHQSSASGGVSISQGGGSASVSAQNGHADANYAGVNEQAGIMAGSGGFNVDVKGNTALTGAVISSTADASQNSLTTGTLTYSDIDNQSHYSATSTGVSAGVGVGNTGKATGPGSVSGSGGGIPMALNESGDQSATTRSAISAGTINVTDSTHQTQDVASLSRDTTDTNGTVSKTPDVNHILSQQADTMAAAQAAGQVVAQGIAAYADGKKADAQKAADAAKAVGDMDAYNAAMADAKSWSEGGTNRTELHVVGGALLGGLGGGGIGSAAAGAAGAGVASALAGKLNGLADQIGSATGSMTLGNVTSNVLAGLSGAMVGGGMGAFTASNADLYNRSTGNGNGQGGTGSQLLDFIGDQLASAGRGAENLANQFAALVNANGPQGPYVSPDDLNGPGGNSKPPATGGSAVPVAVCVPPVCTVVPVATPGTPGYVPSNATLNSGSGDDANSGNSDKSTFWSSTKDKTPVENAYGHSTKHGDEFPEYQNSVQYVQAAQDFVNNPPDGTLTKTRPNGDTLYYDPATNTFASKTKDGAPKTMFKPAAGMDYWNKQ